jgi:hypothetical protein
MPNASSKSAAPGGASAAPPNRTKAAHARRPSAGRMQSTVATGDPDSAAASASASAARPTPCPSGPTINTRATPAQSPKRGAATADGRTKSIGSPRRHVQRLPRKKPESRSRYTSLPANLEPVRAARVIPARNLRAQRPACHLLPCKRSQKKSIGPTSDLAGGQYPPAAHIHLLALTCLYFAADVAANSRLYPQALAAFQRRRAAAPLLQQIAWHTSTCRVENSVGWRVRRRLALSQNLGNLWLDRFGPNLIPFWG